MAIQKTEAYVLRTQPFRSSSLVVTFFTKEFGKLRGLVKGVRREGELRGALFELFTHLEIIFYEKTRSDLHLVTEASILDSHDRVRVGLESIAYASYFSELIDSVCEIHDPHEKAFSLIGFAFRYLPALAQDRISVLFEVKLMNEVGLLPYLERCIKCADLCRTEAFFSVSEGALLCPRCAPQSQDAKSITADTLGALRYIIRHDEEEALKYIPGVRVQAELRALMERFIHYRVHKPLKSKQFLRNIQVVSGRREKVAK